MSEQPSHRLGDTSPHIVYLTAGAAGMYCGSCLHDNLLARELIQQGWDLQLVPTYTPIRTDEPDVSIDQIYFGGINVFLQQKIPLFRILPAALDRFLDAPWLVRRLTTRAHQVDPTLLGRLTVSMLRGMKGNQRKEVRRLIRWLNGTGRPDLIVFSNILIGGCIPEIKRQLAVPILVTLQGDDLFLDQLHEPYRKSSLEAIRQILPHIDRFLVHSDFYRHFMSDYLRIDPERIDVVPLGVATSGWFDGDGESDWVEPQAGIGSESHSSSSSNDSVRIGYLARIAPEKGLHQLVDAFLRLQPMGCDVPLHLDIAGWLGSSHQTYADEQFQRLTDAGLGDSFTWHGTLDFEAKRRFLADIDILSVPTTYREPKGLYVLEAMAAGVPVIQPDHGAFAELVGDSGGGLLFPPHDVEKLAEALWALARDRARRRELANRGRAHILACHTATHAARAMGHVFKKLIG